MRSAIDRDHWLDSLAKSLARDVSRKAFLGVLGSTALALLVPGPGRVAQAQMRRCRAGCTDETFPDCCDGVCTNLFVDAANCQACGRRCGVGEICRQGQCLKPDPLGPQCDPPCGPNEVCKYNLAQQRDVCCAPPFLCGNACYDTPRVRCEGGACCGATQTCCFGSNSWYCCDPGSTCISDAPDNVSPCCPDDRVCNGECCRGPSECRDGACWPTCDCPEGQHCLDSGGTPFGSASSYSGPPDPPVCCPTAEVWDTGTYYGSDRIGRGMCCKEEHRWTAPQASGTAYLCCPPEERWEGFARCCPPRDRWERLGLCCPPEERWEGPGTCGCPPRNRWEGPGLCCPPEERWEGPGTCGCPPRDRWEGPGLCCPPERRCGANQSVCCREYERCNAQNTCDACPALDLNGLWEDNGRRVRIVHQRQAPDQPQSVVATYVEPHTCHHQDGSGRTSRTLLDFRATLRCRILTGEVTVCFWGQRSNPGFRLSPLTLTADLDGRSLSGKWENEEGSGSITLRRLDGRRGTPSPPRGR